MFPAFAGRFAARPAGLPAISRDGISLELHEGSPARISAPAMSRQPAFIACL
jgi:hypothetical protein